MKFTDFIVEMDNMPPSQPEEVDKPVSNRLNPANVRPEKEAPKPKQEWVDSPIIKSTEPIKTKALKLVDVNHPVHRKAFEQSDHDSEKDFEEDRTQLVTSDMAEETNKLWDRYGVGAYQDINAYLRENKTPTLSGENRSSLLEDIDVVFDSQEEEESDMFSEYKRRIQQMEQSIDDEEDREPETFYRGIEGRPYDELEEGEIVTDPGFMSMGKDKDKVREGFAGSDGTLMEILAKGKRRGGRDDEEEVVFPPMSQLKFIDRNNDGTLRFEDTRDEPTMPKTYDEFTDHDD